MTVRRALRHQIRSDDVSDLSNGDSVYYKRANCDQWRGPGIVIGRDGKQVLVRHGGIYVRVHTCRLQHSTARQETITDINSNADSGDAIRPTPAVFSEEDEQSHDDSKDGVPLPPPATAAADNSENEPLYIVPNRLMCAAKRGQRIEYFDGDGERNIATVMSRAGKAGGIHGHCYNIEKTSGDIEWIDLSRVQKWRQVPDDLEVLLSSTTDDVYKAKVVEIENWQQNNVFEKVPDDGQRPVSLRWVVTQKIKDGVPVTRARLVARGFEENLLEHRTDSPTCLKDSLRVVLALVSSFGWMCNSIDIKAAFLQGNKIDRDVFVRPPKEFNDGTLWKLNKNVYGLNDAARAWYSRIKEVLLTLGVAMSRLDPALVYKTTNGVLSGIMCIHVDDIFWAGTASFKSEVMSALDREFCIGSICNGSFKYIGVNIVQRKSCIEIHQEDYGNSLQEISVSRQRASRRTDDLGELEQEEYRALTGQLNWLAAQTRPDVAFDACDLSVVTHKAKVDDILKANKVVKRVKNTSVGLRYNKLENLEQLSIECYSDASFGNLQGGGSQGAYVIFLVDMSGNRCLVSWQSRKVRRVVKSTLAAETLALLDAAEAGIYLASMVTEILNLKDNSPIVRCFVDSKSLVESLYSTKTIEDKHLRINMAVLRDLLERKEIHAVSWVQSAHQLANCLTKRGADAGALLAAIGATNKTVQ